MLPKISEKVNRDVSRKKQTFAVMKSFILFITLSAASITAASAQHYYNDIVSVQQTDKQYTLLKENKIRSVTAVSYEKDNSLTEGFSLTQRISADAQKTTTTISNPATGSSYSTTFYKDNKVARNEDSSANVVTITTYSYDNENRVAAILSIMRDPERKNSSEELHQWLYKPNGTPLKMLKIKDKSDTTVISFSYDEQGNVAEENWQRKGKTFETYYYYYNDKKELTDIVRFNIKAKRLLPDFVFEYNPQGQINKLSQTTTGGANYMIWQYIYNAQGLKQKEVCYDKQKQLVGRIEYSYE